MLPPSNSGICLKPTPKVYTYGQDKSKSPKNTIKWISKKIIHSEKKFLYKIKRIDTGRLGIPIYISIYNNTMNTLTGNKRQMGKGISKTESKVSSLMELAERYSFFNFMHNSNFPILTASQATTNFKKKI